MQEGIHKDKPSVKQKIWKPLALNYDYVEGAQISNSLKRPVKYNRDIELPRIIKGPIKFRL